MARWVMPASAAALWAGILIARALPSVTALALFLPAGVAAAVPALVPSRVPAVSARLLAAAGLGPDRPGPRERILAAAGIPTTELPAPRRRPAAVAALLAGVLLAGMGWWSIRRPDPAALAGIDGRWIRFAATAGSDVRRSDWGWGLEVHLERAWLGDREVPASGRLWVGGGGPEPEVLAGQPVVAEGTVRGLPAEVSGFEEYLRDRGVLGIVDAGEIRAVGPPPNPLMRAANAARQAFVRGASRALERRRSALLVGLAIGDTSAMDPEVEEDFRATGLGHLLAVSGGNVAMFLAPVLGLAVLLGAGGGARLVIGLVSVLFFALVTRWEPSVLRASVMAGLGLAGIFAGRPRNTSVVLGAAVMVLLVASPGLAASLGFQLSVAATAGMVAVANPIAARLRFVPRPVALAAGATVAAQVGVTPLLLLHFGVVPTVTILANVLAFPAVGPALLGGVTAAGAVQLWDPLGRLFGWLGGAFLGYLIELSDRLARAPLPALTGLGPLPAILTATVAVAAVWRLRRGRRRVGTVVTVLAGGVLAWVSIPQAGPPSGLEATFIDVGQGDAALVRTPEGATVLIDTGPEEDQVATELASRGVRRIDLAVASHAHADHIEGFPAVLARFPVGLLIEPGCPAESPSYREMVEAIEAEDVPVRHPRGGDRFVAGEMVMEVLGPDECSPGNSEPNDDSLVVRLSIGEHSILFPGDAEVPAQEDLLYDRDPVEADVLKVPHHGGDTSTEEFFVAAESEVAVVSTGPNDYGHPVPSVLTALEATGATVLRTDLEGDITVGFAGERVIVETGGGSVG